MLYFKILECRSSKYSRYLSYESALWRLRSIPLTYLLVMSPEYFFKNLPTHLSETSFFARKEAKFLIIALVGESPSPDNCSMYLTSSNYCSGARLALAEAAPAYESVKPRCLRAKVLRLMSYFFASARYEKDAPGARNSISLIASWIGLIVVELWVVA